MVACCERLFSSPIPPGMARHGMRSLMLWLLSLPIVLAGSIGPVAVGLWAGTTAYADGGHSSSTVTNWYRVTTV